MGRPRKFDEGAATRAAMEIFWERGYAEATPAVLEAGMGITRSSLYNSFHSKSELYVRALERYVEDESSAVLELLAVQGSAEHRIQSVLDHVVRISVQDERRRGCLVTNAAIERGPDDDSVRSILRYIVDNQVAAFETVVAQGKASGEFSKDLDPREAAHLLVATLNGLRVLARIDPSEQRLTAMAAAAMKGLTHGSDARG